MKIAFIGIVGEELEQDFWGTLKAVAAIGYEGMELGGGTVGKAGVPAAEVALRLRDLGLAPVGYHTTKFAFAEEGDVIIESALALGCPNVIISWGPVESREQLLEDAELYNRIGEQCRDAGLRLTYHNHDHEFQRFDGEYAFDILMEATEPALLAAHLDVAWVTFGGADPVVMVNRYADRCTGLHIKDLVGLEPGSETANGDRKTARFTEVGTGIVDVAGVVDAAREYEIEWLTVEQDRMRDLSPMESLRVSYANLKAIVEDQDA